MRHGARACAEATPLLGLEGFRFEQGSLMRCCTVLHATAMLDLIAQRPSSDECIVVEFKCPCPFFLPPRTRGKKGQGHLYSTTMHAPRAPLGVQLG
jgi:hypothetical protein